MIQERSAKMLNEPSKPIVAPIPTPRPKYDSLQGCDVAKVALYGLPNNLNFDTIDFEQCILECINNKLDERKPDTGLSKRMITEIPIHSIDCGQCSIDGNDGDVHCQKHPIHKYSVAIHKNKLLWALLLEKEEKVELKENESKQAAIGKKKQEEERKENEAKHVDIGKKKEEPKINRNWKILTKIKQNPCGYFQHCFDDIKLCYVNYQQMPNMIIWLIMSMPKRIVKNPTTILRPQPVKIICDDDAPPMSAAVNDAAKFPANLDPTSSPLSSLSSSFSSLSSTTSSASASSLYALVWKCFNEHDVIQLRDVYKHQQSAKRLGQMESLLLQQQHNDGEEGLIANSINRLYRTVGTGTGSADGENHHKLMARQRQPAMIIQESSKTPKTNTITVQQPASNVEVNLKNYLERIPTKNDWKKNKSINHTLYKYLNKSESEFDTTQINLYLRQKRLHQKRSSSCHGSARNTRTTTTSSRVYEMPIDDLGKLPPLPPPIKKNHQRHHQRSSSTLAATVDQLNSEGSSLNSSDESCSSSGEFNDINFPSATPTSTSTATPIVVKSVLKKTKSDDHHGDHYQTSGGGGAGSSPKNQHYFASSLAMLGDKLRSSWNNHGGHQQQHHHKKNVTFSAYATIQVVDT